MSSLIGALFRVIEQTLHHVLQVRPRLVPAQSCGLDQAHDGDVVHAFCTLPARSPIQQRT